MTTVFDTTPGPTVPMDVDSPCLVIGLLLILPR
jgi:hypothetical protein